MDWPLRATTHGKPAKRACLFSSEENGCDISGYLFMWLELRSPSLDLSKNAYAQFYNAEGETNLMLRLLTIMLAIIATSGCAGSGRIVQVTDAPVVGPKIIALDAPSAPWVIEIQSKLKQKGFKVLRWSSRTRVSEQTASNRVETFNEAEARYVLVIDGYAPYDWANRCFGGGYRFSHISTDLVDVATNETILNVNGSGYSENCPPMSGTIFSDIANAVNAAWK